MTPALPPAATAGEPAFSMQAMRGVRRLLLVFTPSVQDPAFLRQKELLDEAADGLAQRDVTVVEVVGVDLGSAGGATISPDETARLRSDWSAALHVLTVVLVGKDGMEKLRANQPVSDGPLFALIDSLPMRQAETANARGN